MKKNQELRIPRPLFGAGDQGRYLPHTLAVIVDITLEEAARGLEDGELGYNLYLMIHECTHFWQLSCSSYGMFRAEAELCDQMRTMAQILDTRGSLKLPIGAPHYSSKGLREFDKFRSRTNAWDGYDVYIVRASVDNFADRITHGSESEPPIWYLPLKDSPDLLRLPIGTRSILECAAEVIGRTGLPRSQAIKRQVALMPYSQVAFPHCREYWHYSAAHVYFASVISDHPMSVSERDGLFLDVVDLSLLIAGINGNAVDISPGHRFLYLTQATNEVLKGKRIGETRADTIRTIFSEAGFGDHSKLCQNILDRKAKPLSNIGGSVVSPLGPIYGQLLSYFERAMELRMNDPTTFGSALLSRQGQERIFSLLPPCLIFYRDKWWVPPKWWTKPGDRQYLSIGRGYDPVLSHFFLASIVDQAAYQTSVQCPLRALDVGTPCGCDLERSGAPAQVPMSYQIDGHCHFLSLWEKLESGVGIVE